MSKKKLSASKKARQFAVVPVRLRKDGTAKILLLTSRGKGEWGIPKGWPMTRLSPKATARQEAFEEAGLKGRVLCGSVGQYRYRKASARVHGRITVKVFILKVSRQLDRWPEKHERKTRWFSPAKAARAVRGQELGPLLRRAAKLARTA